MKSRSLVYLTALTAVVLGLTYRYLTSWDYVIGRSEGGKLRGVKTSTWGGTKYFSFKGIPYARAPVGALRFKAPVESAAWSGVRDAVYHGSVCPQKDMVFGFFRGEEDCLFLNVYTPSMEGNELPVMVWIHGGSFTMGSGNDELYGPDLFLDEGVILVTLNYRLGALGFLNTKNGVIPGNAGLKDQNFALRWVKRNIGHFGGDPEKVTLFGQSAGGASVNYHMLSPMSKGLFSRAISQSGSAFSPLAQSKRGHEFAVRLAKYFGLENPSNEGEILRKLQSVPYEDLVYGQEEIRSGAESKILLLSLFLPSVEINVNPAEAFLPNSSLGLVQSGTYNKVPQIIGYNSEEGLMFVKEYMNPENRESAVKNPEQFVPEIFDSGPEKNRKFAESLRNLYFPEGSVTEENILNLVNLYSDLVFVSGINRAVELFLETSDQPIYHYVFSYDGGFNVIKLFLNIKLPGASHCYDLRHIFLMKLVQFLKPFAGSTDGFVSETLVRLWTNFAKYGNPTPDGDAVTWKPLTKTEFNHLNMTGEGFFMEEKRSSERSLFWQNVYKMSVS